MTKNEFENLAFKNIQLKTSSLNIFISSFKQALIIDYKHFYRPKTHKIYLTILL